MAKGDKMKSQTQPPTGIRYKAWARKINRSDHSSKNSPGNFTISCPNRECTRRQHPSGAATGDKSIRCGVDGITKCPSCGTAIPRSGYVDAK